MKWFMCKGYMFLIVVLLKQPMEQESKHGRWFFFFFFANVNSTKIWNMSLQGGYGFAKGIIFEQLTFESVVHPILIDQHYCTGLICPRKVLIRFVNHYHYFLKSASENYSNVLCFQLGTHKEIRSSCEWYSFHWTNRYELKPRSDHVELQ